MRVVEVIPIVRGITKPSLSYFTKEKFEPGSFVRIPIKNSNCLGVVAKSFDARKAKSSIKKADFALKKIALSKGNIKLSNSFMKAAEETASFYGVALGSVLGVFLPKLFIENTDLLSSKFKEKLSDYKETKLVQAGDTDRFREYKSIIRESFAKNSSVFFVVPTHEDAFKAVKELSMGIESFVYSPIGQSAKRAKSELEKARNERHPILFISTPTYLAFDRPDFRTFILEKENSRSYRTLLRPFLDLKYFVEAYAKSKGANFVLGDSVLSLETLWLEKEGVYSSLSPLTWRLKYDSLGEIIDMRALKEFRILSDRLSGVLEMALSENKKVFLFGTRKGLSSTTVCSDCASLLLCKNCNAPLVLHNSKEEAQKTFYLCHYCGAKRSSEIKCDNCQSWKLTPLGIGVDRIKEECEKMFPDARIFVLDKDQVKTKSKAKKLINEFLTTDKSILVGTELALEVLPKIPVVAAVSLDSLFSIPNFHINEKIFYLVTRLRELATERFLIQTRNAGVEVLKNAAAGNILDFYRQEMKEREELLYPPFSVFVKVSTEDSKDRLNRKAAELQSSFYRYNPHFILNKGSKSGSEALSMIMRLPRDEWPVEDVMKKILLLTPDFSIKVNPESIV